MRDRESRPPFSSAGKDAAWTGLAAVTGLTAEARIARRAGWKVIAGGGTAAGARNAARAAVRAGATGLISFGLAGGLDPTLRPGTILVPDTVISGERRYLADLTLSQYLRGPTPQAILGAFTAAVTATEKRRLFTASGAAALDLESGAVAQEAADHSIPFAVLRVVCDPAWRDLPAAALMALDAEGTIRLKRVLHGLFAHPHQLPALLAIARDAAAARRALRRRIAAIRP